MSSFLKKCIIFCAVYLVALQGGLLILLAAQKGDIISFFNVLTSGGILLLFSFVAAKVLKRVFHKHRPPKGIEFFKPYDRYAFPSGHATGVFSLAYFIVIHDYVLGVASLIIALVVVTARVKSHVHSLTDILGGAAVGIFVTYGMLPYVTPFVQLLVERFF